MLKGTVRFIMPCSKEYGTLGFQRVYIITCANKQFMDTYVCCCTKIYFLSPPPTPTPNEYVTHRQAI